MISNELYFSMTFEWSENKNVANIKKHGVSFQEAMSMFADPLSDTFEDIYAKHE
ncbi:MAG: hypothetical protein IEMM0008_0633 [bacterium]|nr:MAG: hypothetical protein IEMM0008_0633 [bacterium]